MPTPSNLDGDSSSSAYEVVKQEWYNSRQAFGLSKIPFGQNSGSIEYTLVDECYEENGINWRYHFCDYLITNHHLGMLLYPLSSFISVLCELYGKYMEEGNKSYGMQNYVEAISFYRKSIASLPKQPDYYLSLCNAYMSLGRAMSEGGDFGGAVQYLTTALNYLPSKKLLTDHASDLALSSTLEYCIRIALGNCCNAQGQVYEAATEYELSYALSPSLNKAENIYQALNMMAKQVWEQKKWEEMIYIEQAVNRLRPDPLRLHTNLSLCYRQLGDLTSAEREGLTALKINPNAPFALQYLGDTYTALEEFSSAVYCYQRLIKANPEFDIGYFPYAFSLLEMGKITEARSELDKILSREPDHPYANRLKKIITNLVGEDA